MKQLFCLALAGLLALPVAQAGTLYKWVDADGKVHYTDRPPPPSAGRVEQRSIESEAKPAATPGRAALDEAVARNPITLYSIPRCSTCDLARLYLNKRQVPFTEKNVSAGNDVNQKEMIQKVGELVVPTITVGARVMKGAYVESLLESELELAGYPKAESETGAGSGEGEPPPPPPPVPEP